MNPSQEERKILEDRDTTYIIYLSQEERDKLYLAAALQRRRPREQAEYYIVREVENDIAQYNYEKAIGDRVQEMMQNPSPDIPMPFPSAGTPPVPSPIPETLTEAQNQGKHNRIFTEQSTTPIPAPTPEAQNDDKSGRLVLYLPTEDWEAVNYWAKSAGISPTIMTEKIIHNWSHSSILLPLDSDSA